MGEGSSPDAQRAHAGEESYGHHVLHGHICDAHATALLDTLQEVLDKSVHPLAQTLKHDKSQRDSQDGIKHAKGLPCVGPRRSMPITWEESRQIAEVSDAGSFLMAICEVAVASRALPAAQKALDHFLFTNMTKQEICLRVCERCQKGYWIGACHRNVSAH